MCWKDVIIFITKIYLVVYFSLGELAKYDMLHEAIVHRCIKQVIITHELLKWGTKYKLWHISGEMFGLCSKKKTFYCSN